MKNKKLSWILLPVVLIVWGMIGWKVYAACCGSEEDIALNDNYIEVRSDSSVVPDTYQLTLNYRDPFLDEQVVRKGPNSAQKSLPADKKNTAKPEPFAQEELPAIQYYGLVKETMSDKTVGFLKVNGETFFVKQHDLVNGVKVEKIWSDSVEVNVGSKRTIIRK